MRRFLLSTAVLAGIALLLGVALLSTLRAQASGPLAVSNADLLDMGSLARLRVSLVSTGGQVVRVLPHGAVVAARGGQLLTVLFSRQATFLQEETRVDQGAVELRAHLSLQGLRRNATTFAAYKVRISPHHQAIGGVITSVANNLLTIMNRHGGLTLVKVQPTTPVFLDKHRFGGPLRVGLRVRVLAVPEPLLRRRLYLVTAVSVLRSPRTTHLGGLVRLVDARLHVITVYSKNPGRTYAVEVISTTRMTLGAYPVSYAALAPGDHVTVVGRVEPAPLTTGPAAVVAATVRINSPSFTGVITAVTPTAGGGLALTVRGRHGHVLRINAPGKAAVVYGGRNAHVQDLIVGERVAASGRRTGAFSLLATRIRVYPHPHSVGGLVANVLPGRYRIVDGATGQQYVIHVAQGALYLVNGKPATAAAVKVGLHVRVRGFDVLHSDQKGLPTINATRVSVAVRRPHPASHRPAARRAVTPRKTAHP